VFECPYGILYSRAERVAAQRERLAGTLRLTHLQSPGLKRLKVERSRRRSVKPVMLRIPLIKPDLPPLEAVEAPLREVLTSGKITNFGPYVTEFEKEAGAYLGAPAVSTSSGTMGLVLALQALGLELGQKAVLPSFTFMATGQAVLYAGGVPVFAEIEDDLNLSPADLEGLLRTHDDIHVVIPVHTYGLPSRVDEIRQVVDEAATRRGTPIHLLFDAAHAFGSALNGTKVGVFGEAEVFSLSVTKMLVSVEGGLVSSRSEGLLARIRKMRNYGIEANYDAHWPGVNSKMSELHAIIGLYNLRRLDALIAARQGKARYYLERIRSQTHFELLPFPETVVHTFKDFTVLVPQTFVTKRDVIMHRLAEKGIETRAYFSPPVHRQRYFQRFADRPLPRTDALAKRVMTLPFYTSITEAEMDFVVEALAEAERALQ